MKLNQLKVQKEIRIQILEVQVAMLDAQIVVLV